MPTTVAGSGNEDSKDILKNTVKDFNERFGTNFSDEGKLKGMLLVEDVDNHLELFNNYHDNQDFKAYLTKCIDKMVSEKLRKII